MIFSIYIYIEVGGWNAISYPKTMAENKAVELTKPDKTQRKFVLTVCCLKVTSHSF
jgi:hypothetical protein